MAGAFVLYFYPKGGDGMNERQRKFAEYYIQCGNAGQAAEMAGYSPKYAAQNADKLLKNTNVQAYLAELRAKMQDDAILTAKERQAILSGLARSDDVAPADRIKSIDVLNKMTGEYISKLEVSGTLSAEMSKLDSLVKQMSDNA